LRVLRFWLPLVRFTDRRAAAGAGGPDAVQAQYDAARKFQEALRPAEPVSRSCRPLLAALRAYVDAEIEQVEGYDRPWPPLARQGVRKALAASSRIEGSRRACHPGRAVATRSSPPLATPRSDEVFFGKVQSPAPRGTAVAEITLGRYSFKTEVLNDRLDWTVPAALPPGRYDIRVRFTHDRRFCKANCAPGVALSRRVWLLPPTAIDTTAPMRRSVALSARLASLSGGFDGYSGIWTHDLRTGTTASWNADARFPAASTVKLALLIAALSKFGPNLEESPVGADLRAVTGWSSNAAANRLLVELGGSEAGGDRIANDVLRRIGATSSTYTGFYRLGTAGHPSGNRPPLISSRVTTARDLGRILFLLHRGAVGDDGALRVLGLTPHEARVGLDLLLSWSAPPPHDNMGNLVPSLPSRVPVAQKNGWFSAVRHTAALIYGPSGPKIVVVLTYRPRISLASAQQFGARIVELVGADR
jgi:hypothetical protein